MKVDTLTGKRHWREGKCISTVFNFDVVMKSFNIEVEKIAHFSFVRDIFSSWLGTNISKKMFRIIFNPSLALPGRKIIGFLAWAQIVIEYFAFV